MESRSLGNVSSSSCTLISRMFSVLAVLRIFARRKKIFLKETSTQGRAKTSSRTQMEKLEWIIPFGAFFSVCDFLLLSSSDATAVDPHDWWYFDCSRLCRAFLSHSVLFEERANTENDIFSHFLPSDFEPKRIPFFLNVTLFNSVCLHSLYLLTISFAFHLEDVTFAIVNIWTFLSVEAQRISAKASVRFSRMVQEWWFASDDEVEIKFRCVHDKLSFTQVRSRDEECLSRETSTGKRGTV